MAIPDYQAIMLPLLKIAGDKKEHSVREAIEVLADQYTLNSEERKELLPSGQQTIFNNRVGWARTYMKKAQLLESPKRGYLIITEQGSKVLKQNPKEINVKFLEQFPEFIEFRMAKREKDGEEKTRPVESEENTPLESLEYAYQKIQDATVQELLNVAKNCSPQFLEKLVVGLLLKMGYGGSIKDAGTAIGQTGDEGIDGIIKEDKLGLDTIYIQAKKWGGTVGRPEIHKFVGALEGQRARKGIFITTSSFSNDALEYVAQIDKKIILIDGQKLAQLMFENDIGVSKIISYEVKKVDSDYFDEE